MIMIAMSYHAIRIIIILSDLDNISTCYCIPYHEIFKESSIPYPWYHKQFPIMVPWINGRDGGQPCLVSEGVNLENDL